MTKAQELLYVIESLYAPGIDEFREFVFRDYSKKYNSWISKGGQEKQPSLLPVLKANFKKFTEYNSDNFKYTLPEVIDTYRKDRTEELEKKYNNYGDKKEKAIQMGLSYYGINTL